MFWLSSYEAGFFWPLQVQQDIYKIPVTPNDVINVGMLYTQVTYSPINRIKFSVKQMLYSFECIYEIIHGCVYEMEGFKMHSSLLSLMHWFNYQLPPSPPTPARLCRWKSQLLLCVRDRGSSCYKWLWGFSAEEQILLESSCPSPALFDHYAQHFPGRHNQHVWSLSPAWVQRQIPESSAFPTWEAASGLTN